MEVSAVRQFMVSADSGRFVQSAQDGEAAARDELRAAAEGFEALFINTMLKSARTEAFADDLTSSSAVRSAQSLFDMKISEAVSGSSNLGIADAVVRQLSPLVRYKG